MNFEHIITCIENRDTCIIIRNNFEWSGFLWAQFFELSYYKVEFVQAEIIVAVPEERLKNGEYGQLADGRIPGII